MKGKQEANDCGYENRGAKKVEFLNAGKEGSTLPGLSRNVEDEGNNGYRYSTDGKTGDTRILNIRSSKKELQDALDIETPSP